MVVTEGSLPFLPQLELHEIDHLMATLAFSSSCEELFLYVYMQLLVPVSPSRSFHALPGPRHVNFPELLACGSPGLTMS